MDVSIVFAAGKLQYCFCHSKNSAVSSRSFQDLSVASICAVVLPDGVVAACIYLPLLTFL